MDVEQKTIIQAGMDPSQFVQAADQLATSVEDAGARITTANTQVIQSIGKVTLAQVDNGAGFQRLAAQLDPSVAAMQRYQTTVDKLNGYLAAGRIQTTGAGTAQDEYNRLLGLAKQRYEDSIDAAGRFGKATEGVAGSTRATTAIVREATRGYLEMSAGMSPLQIAAANFGNIEHAAEKFGGAVKTAIEFLTSPTGLILATSAAILAIGASAESTQTRMLGLQTALRGTRDDFTAMAVEADRAARVVAQSGAATLEEATTAAKAFAAQPSFQGTQTQLQALITTANDLAAVMGVTLPVEAAKLADAMNAPGKMAQELADVHFKGMNDELARSIQLQQDAGDKAGAYARLLDAIKASTHGAAEESKTNLQRALDDLNAAFIRTDASGKSVANSLGKAFDDMASHIIGTLAKLTANLGSMISQADAAGRRIGSSLNPLDMSFWIGNGGVRALANGGSGAGSVTTPAAIAPLLTAAAAANGIDPALLARLQAAEGVMNADGSWQTSSTGAIGPMQVTGSTFRGIQAQPGAFPTAAGLTDVTDVGQNVQAGAALFAHLLTKYGDPTLAVLAYHDGETLIDQVLASGGSASPSAAALAEAQKVVSGYTGTGLAPGTSTVLPDVSVTAPRVASGAASETGQVVDDAQKIADAVKLALPGSTLKTFQDADAAIRRDVDALARLKAQGVTTGDDVRVLTDDLNKQNAALTAAVSPIQGVLNALTIQIKSEDDMAAAWDKGSTAAANMQLQIKAEADARKIGGERLAQNVFAVGQLTDKYREAAAAQQNDALAQASNDNQRTLDYLNAEISSLGQDADARARNLAILKETQNLQKNDPFASDERKQAAIAEAAAIADATSRLQEQQQAMQTLASMTSSLFGTIADDISQAFVSGQSAAITFGNVWHAVLTQIIKDILQLAVIGPISNSLFGTNQTTLGNIFSIGSAAGGSGSAAGGISLTGALSTGSSLVSGASSISQLLGYQGIGSYLGEQLGLSGSSGLLSGVGTGITGALSTPIYGSGFGIAGGFASDSAISGGAAAGGFIPTATLGSFLGGVGGGFAAGSLSGSLIQGALGKSGPAPVIGAGVGALAGAGIGTLIGGPYGTLLGGLLGGLIGGSGGGFIGPGPQSAYSGTVVGLSNGLLNVGQSFSQREASSLPQTQSDVDMLNSYLQGSGLKLSTIGNLGSIGVNGSGQVDPTKYGSLAAALPNFRFTDPNNSTLNNYLSDRSYPDIETLRSDITEWVNLTGTVIPGLTNQVKVTGSLADAITQINATFQPAIDSANKFGVATDDLTTAQNKAIDAANAAAKAQADALSAQIAQRDIAAQATLGAGPGAAEAFALSQFDAQLQTQRDQLSTQLVGIFGDSFKTTQDFADRMAALEKTLGDERLAIVKQYADQIAAAQKAIDQTDVSLVGRAMTANATLSGSPLDAEAAALYNFQANAQTQVDALQAQFTALYGSSYASTQQYQDELLQLEKTLGVERLAVVKQYTDQIAAADAATAQAQADALAAQTAQAQSLSTSIQAQADAAQKAIDDQNAAFFAQQAQQAAQAAAQQQQLMDQAASSAAQTIASLTAYTQTLQTSSASPLSPIDQLTLARRQFQAVGGAAGAGDYNSISQLQTYANSFLSASRVVNGSGAAYANDFQAVLDALNKAATVSPDTLTASVLQMETRTQTATLVDQLTQLRAAVDGITAQLRQDGNAPARLAA